MLTTTSGTDIPTNSLTVIASGTLTLPDARNSGPTVVQFANTTAYASYVVVFPTVKSSPTTTLTQIAEVKLSQGMNAPNAIAMGTARGGQLSGSTFTFGTIGTTFSVNNWPAGQSPDNALDGDVNANFLLFKDTGMGLVASPSSGAAAVNQLSFWTAADAPERDPISYAVYGFNTVVTQTTGTLAVGTAIAAGTLTLPDVRVTGPTTVSFTNDTAYASDLVVFPAVKNVPASTITQIAEVQFGYVAANTASTDITLSNSSLAENNVANATVGTLTATDAEAGQTQTFTLVAGTGSTDNAAFTITGSTLTLNASADFETQSSYDVRLRVTDNGTGNLTFEKAFTITITDVNEAPTNLTLSNATLAENNAANATVGTLTATDSDAGNTHTFTLVTGTGSTDNAVFTITGNVLKINAVADYDTQSSYSIRLRATDSGAGNLTFEKDITITITNVNEAPIAEADTVIRADTTQVVKVLLTSLLTNDSDPENDALSIIAVGNALPSGATVTISGAFAVYTVPNKTAGNGSFTYTVSDGSGGQTVTANVTIIETASPPSESPPNAAQISMVGGNAVLSYFGVPGRTYNVQYTTNTGAPYTWNEFSPPAALLTPANGVITYTDVNPGGSMRFYRSVGHR